MKRFITVLLTCCILMSSFLAAPGYAANDYLEVGGIANNQSERMLESAPRLNWYAWAARAVWEIIKYTSNEYWYEAPEINGGWPELELLSGSIHFNDAGDNIGSSVSMDVELTSRYSDTHADIIMSATTAWPASMTSESISVILLDSSGDMVINDTVTSRSRAIYEITEDSQEGEYKAIFSENDRVNWSCRISIYDYSTGGGGPVTPEPYSTGGRIVSSENSFLSNEDASLAFDCNNEEFYVIPSSDFAEATNIEQYYYTFEDLSNLRFDEDKQMYINAFRGINAGERIRVVDTIKSIEFNADKNYSSLVFDIGYHGELELRFDGDLTKEYSANDSIQFEFSVVEVFSYAGFSFTELDYFISSENCVAYPSAEDYIVYNCNCNVPHDTVYNLK